MIGSGFQNVFKIPELKKRIIFTLAAALLLLPVPRMVNLLGVMVLAIGWFPGFLAHRKEEVFAGKH